MVSESGFERVERSVREVYDYCPPTFTHYSPEGRAQYARQWEWFMSQLGLSPDDFLGKRLLDVGCGSCEKATFYCDWGAHVTGLEMTPSVIDRAREVIGQRNIKIVPGSIFTASFEQPFDIVIADGVLHHTADTFVALKQCVEHLKDGGILVLGLVNVWGAFWWFSLARTIVSLLGRSDFHRRAYWGRTLFGWTRKRHEGTSGSSAYYRAIESWSYDWFANPRWNRHSPSEILGWLPALGLEHLKSVPSIVEKAPSRNFVAQGIRLLTGKGHAMMGWYWLSNSEPNMLYVCARKRPDKLEPHHLHS